MIKILNKAVTPKTDTLIWSEDDVIELHEDHLILKRHYIAETPVDKDDSTLGTKERTMNYESLLIKRGFTNLEYYYDMEDEKYGIQFIHSGACTQFLCENKAKAVLIYEEIKEWLLKEKSRR